MPAGQLAEKAPGDDTPRPNKLYLISTNSTNCRQTWLTANMRPTSVKPYLSTHLCKSDHTSPGGRCRL
jgi:hypothetical protein